MAFIVAAVVGIKKLLEKEEEKEKAAEKALDDNIELAKKLGDTLAEVNRSTKMSGYGSTGVMREIKDKHLGEGVYMDISAAENKLRDAMIGAWELTSGADYETTVEYKRWLSERPKTGDVTAWMRQEPVFGMSKLTKQKVDDMYRNLTDVKAGKEPGTSPASEEEKTESNYMFYAIAGAVVILGAVAWYA